MSEMIGDLHIETCSEPVSSERSIEIDGPEALARFGEQTRQAVHAKADAVKKDTLAAMNSVAAASALPQSAISSLRQKINADHRLKASFQQMDLLAEEAAAAIDDVQI